MDNDATHISVVSTYIPKRMAGNGVLGAHNGIPDALQLPYAADSGTLTEYSGF
jgi:hypothetical protein